MLFGRQTRANIQEKSRLLIISQSANHLFVRPVIVTSRFLVHREVNPGQWSQGFGPNRSFQGQTDGYSGQIKNPFVTVGQVF